MRTFYAIVLTTMGCMTAESVVAPTEEQLDDDEAIDKTLDPTPGRLAPRVCATRAWPVRGDTDPEFTVVGTREGASVFTVPKAGGAVRAFRVDGRGDLVGELVTIRDDHAYTDISASISAGRLVLAATAGTKTTIDLVRDDLGARHALADLEGEFAAPILALRDSRLALVGGATGLTANSFDGAAWAPGAPQQITADPIVSMTAVPYLGDVMVAWSTESKQCHLRRVGALRESVRSFACDAGRLAVDPVYRGGVLVYEDGTDVYRTEIRVGGESELANRIRVAELASSPRAAFDGTRLWVSYLNARGDVVVGFIDHRGELISRALEGIRPDRDGYELAAFADGLWLVVSLGELGAGSLRLCAIAE